MDKIDNTSVKYWQKYIKSLGTLNEVIFDSLQKSSSKMVFADSTGMELSADKFLTVSILFKNLLKKRLQKQQNVGLLLPSTAAGAFTNYALLLEGKTVVNLNYTADINSIIASIELSSTKTVITSKKFIEKLESKGINLQELLSIVDVIYLEDLKTKISKIKGLFTLFCVKFLPTSFLKKIHLNKINKDDTVAILFSSGSEGKPKGIELTSDNILGNTKQIAKILNASENDILVNSLPIFHVFGLTVTTFFPLVEGIKCVAHPDPTDGVGIGNLIQKYKATILTGTSTFFRLYTKNNAVKSDMFKSLRLVVAGAEKLRDNVREDFEKKFGKELLEGYGTSETSPVVSCNLPENNKKGTVGTPVPGTNIKIVNPDTFEELSIGDEGMILVSGIQVMKGYLLNESKTSEVLKIINGETFYITGDKGKLDKDGFLTIVDRYSRFAKLGGEMVSLGSVEEKVSKLIKNEDIDFIATSLDDDKKGEKIILLISGVNEEFIRELKYNIIHSFDSKLMIPSVIKIVDEIPRLGSGKKDFKAAKELARQVI